MEATDSSTGSYAWHNILKGHNVLLNDARWRVGSGESVGVWLNSWFPSCEHPRVFSLVINRLKEARVVDLIDPVSRQCDSILLQGLFNPHEVDLIKSIPLCRSYSDDKLIWPYTSLGHYTVELGYSFSCK